MSKHGVLIISHGSRDQSWVAEVDQTVNQAKLLYYEALAVNANISIDQLEEQFPIVSSFLELVEGRLIQDGINILQNKGVTHIHVLPLFVSAGSTHVEEIKQAFGFAPAYEQFIGDLEPFICKCEVSFDLPLIDDKEIVHIIKRQLETLSIHDNGDVAVLILGHGSTVEPYYKLWEQGMQQLIDKLKLHFSTLDLYYASLLPERSKKTLAQLLKQYKQVTVIPLFLSAGYFTSHIIPSRLEGLTYIYSGETLLPSEEMKQLLVRRFQTLFK